MKTINVEISPEVRKILEQGSVDGDVYFLPEVTLDRNQYVEVNKILELLGGKWSRTKKGHVFSGENEARSVIGALEQGSVVDKKKTYQFFETPVDVAKTMVELLDVQTGMSVLEPSAGHGAILEFLPKDVELHIMEIDPEKCAVLESKGYTSVDCVDFLSTKTNLVGTFDRIIMNPPFTKGQDAEHILHAYHSLNEIGRLVAVASASVTFNQQKKYQQLRHLVERSGKIIRLDSDSFKESGTSVETVLVVLDKKTEL